MKKKICHFYLDDLEDATLTKVFTAIRVLARRELGREPTSLQFQYPGEDGKARHHEFNFN